MINAFVLLVFYPLAGDPVTVAVYDTESDCAAIAAVIRADLETGASVECEVTDF